MIETGSKFSPHRVVNRGIEGFASLGPVRSSLDRLIHLYAAEATLVDTHSGITADTLKEMQTTSPFEAIRKASERKKGRPLTDSETTVLYVNTMIGGGIELLGRQALRNTQLRQRYSPQIKRLAQRLYEAADWVEGGTGTSPEVKVFQQRLEKRDKAAAGRNQTVREALEVARQEINRGIDRGGILKRWYEGTDTPEERQTAVRIMDNIIDRQAAKHGVRGDDVRNERDQQLNDFFGE